MKKTRLKINSKEFSEQFNLEKFGFYDLVPYSDGVGFSVKKDFKNSKFLSLISVFIIEYSQKKDLYKVYLHATFGEPTKDGVKIRTDYKAFDPIDIENSEDYFFNISKRKFFDKKNNKIDPNKIINIFYKEHIKSTKLFKGLLVRIKIWFFRKFLNFITIFIKNIFYWILFLISGEKYLFNYFEDQIIESDKKHFDERKSKETRKEKDKVDFFGYSASKWSIISYALFHLSTFLLLSAFDYKPFFLKTLFENHFLTIIYVISSLWFFEIAVPSSCRFFIRNFSKLSFRLKIKRIKI